jgi:hypothetical protein
VSDDTITVTVEDLTRTIRAAYWAGYYANVPGEHADRIVREYTSEVDAQMTTWKLDNIQL